MISIFNYHLHQMATTHAATFFISMNRIFRFSYLPAHPQSNPLMHYLHGKIYYYSTMYKFFLHKLLNWVSNISPLVPWDSVLEWKFCHLNSSTNCGFETPAFKLRNLPSLLECLNVLLKPVILKHECLVEYIKTGHKEVY